MLPKFDWKDAVRIVMALVASGFIWTVDNRLAVLSLAAMVIVWLVKFYALKTGKSVGKFTLTLVLLALSIVGALVFEPVSVPLLPTFSGDVFIYINSIFGWLGAMLLIGKEVFAVATGLYNILLAKVLEKLEPPQLLKPLTV